MSEQNKGVHAFLGGAKPIEKPEQSAYRQVSVDLIDPCSAQPRKIFDETELLSLSESIKENGIIQPLIVTQTGERFELIAGERRLRASKLAGLLTVPVVIKETTENSKAIMALIENIQRKDLSTLEIAESYNNLLVEYKISKEDLSKKIGVNRSVISNYVRVLNLPKEVIALIELNKLSFGHAKVLGGLKDKALVIDLANKCAVNQIPVAKLEKMIKTAQDETSKGEAPKTEEDTSFEKHSEPVVQRLIDKLQLPVQVVESKDTVGKITIHFKNKDELDKILNIIKE